MLFQVHLWLGVAMGLYVIFICLTGSLIVFRRELDQQFCLEVVTSTGGERLSVPCEPAFVTGWPSCTITSWALEPVSG